jgi:hypothetical protein
MLRIYSIPTGSTRRAMVEHDLAHIESVLLRASDDVLENTALPPPYWRERLRQIRDGGQLLETQLKRINALLLVLDRRLTSERANGRMARLGMQFGRQQGAVKLVRKDSRNFQGPAGT